MKWIDFDNTFYQKSPQTVLAFHGCDRSTAEEILNSWEKHLSPSENTYDWLGTGIYFWLNDPFRAYEWACEDLEYSINNLNEQKLENKRPDEGAGIKEKSHIQICVRNTNCIKGYFLPRIALECNLVDVVVKKTYNGNMIK